MEQLIDRNSALRIIGELVESYVRRHHRAPRTIIVIGGTAMAMRRLRERSLDIDIFHPDDAFAEVARELEERSGYRIDVTNRRTLWGEIAVLDIESDAEVMETLEIEGFTVDIAAISPETLFVIKASSMRDKDRADLGAIMTATSPEKVIERAGYLIGSLEYRYLKQEILANILAEMQLVLLDAVSPSWFTHAPTLVRDFGDFITNEFGVVVEED
ncbi:MAG: DUF6036 family nucleotidyltransferase [Ferrimicrobium sp.]